MSPAAAPATPIVVLGVWAILGGGGGGDSADDWQQQVHYTIRAALEERSGVLDAAGRLVYRNRSPDTLTALYLHLYLNAFRPRSRWAEQELTYGVRRFTDLPEPYYAFERLGPVAVNGVAVAPSFPGAPDSTVARLGLPAPLVPGDSLVVDLAWQARPSAIPRRQGREVGGRRFDFAQWYPKVAVYDRQGWQAHALYPQGEFYGEFGTYDVTLDLSADQVVAATGVPVEGDPGWTRARADQNVPVTPQRDWYAGAPPLRAPPLGGPPPGPGRKLVRFYAEDVHDFAWSLNPDYVYEEGRYGATVIRALYLNGDRETWGGGRVIERAARALAWLDSLFGPYPYPQLTLAHRIEGGGTEFPMLVMIGGPSESLVFHEVGHVYLYGILANNEWKEAWLDEGFTTFQTGWNLRRRGMGAPIQSSQRLVLELDLDGWSQPVATPADQFREFPIYVRMAYTKGQLIFEMLRYVLGEDTFRRVLREYYARYRLKHVSEEAFRRVAEEVSGRDLGWFFRQWLHAVPLVDYALGGVERRRGPEGTWRTRVRVERQGDGVMPVDVAIPLAESTLVVRLPGTARRESLEVRTATRPGRVALDPARETMDWNYTNNTERLAGDLFRNTPYRVNRIGGRLGSPRSREFQERGEPSYRDRSVRSWLPALWYSSAGGATLGVIVTGNYLGLYDRHGLELSQATRTARWPSLVARMHNPTWARAPRRRVGVEAWSVEGRAGVAGFLTWLTSPHLSYGPERERRVSLTLQSVRDASFVDRWLWERVTVLELMAREEWRWRRQEDSVQLRLQTAVGSSGGPDEIPREGWVRAGSGLYVRHSAELVYRRARGGYETSGRVFGGFHLLPEGAPLQRRFFVAGAGPYETFGNPYLRSRGSLLARRGVNYHSPGGGNVRAFDRGLSSSSLLAANLEAASRLLPRASGIAAGVTVAFFADLALADLYRVYWDAGVGLRVARRIGLLPLLLRLDFPLVVNRPAEALEPLWGESSRRVAPRWVFSFERSP